MWVVKETHRKETHSRDKQGFSSHKKVENWVFSYRDMKKDFTEKDIQIANKRIKRSSTSLDFREMWIKDDDEISLHIYQNSLKKKK